MSMKTEKSASTILSILKAKRNSTPNRVRFQLPENLREIFIDFKRGVNEDRYTDLVCTVRDCPVDDEALLKLLHNAERCVSLLDHDLRLFVQALVILGWNYRSEKVVARYEDFIIALVSAHSYYADFVIDQLVKLFATTDSADWVDHLPNSNQAGHLENVHHILKSVLKTVPMSEEFIVKKLRANFPHHLLSSCKYLTYLHSCVQVMDYLPHSRHDILLLLVDRLMTLDVHTNKDDLLMTASDDMLDGSLADTLDSGMLMMFQYIEHVCRPDGGEVSLANTKALFHDLMLVMDECILRTYASYHVQFLVFYMCSIHQSVAQSFLKRLWQKVESPGEANVIRKTAISYIASFIARADFLSNGFLKHYLHLMSCWIHKYILDHDHWSSDARLVDVHIVFYHVCQAVFYLIAFRQNELFDSTKKLAFLQSLNLAKVVHCSLNPLAACHGAVVENFAEVAKDYQLAYCYTVMERNERMFLQRPTIDGFFPFDPYLLKRSSRYISPLYREYHRELTTVDDDLVAGTTTPLNEETTMDCSTQEDDDFIQDRSLPIAIKKSDLHFGSSPGFKMSI